MERDGTSALLRSLAVHPGRRKSGIAAALVDTCLKSARESGIREVYLLTGMAEKYLERRGFTRVERSAIPAGLLGNSVLEEACPSCSTCMKIGL